MPPIKPKPFMKPTLETRFHIDYEWWKDTEQDLRSYLLSHLRSVDREHLEQAAENKLVDYIHPDTGEVFQLDALRLAIQQAAEDEDFINPHTSLVDGVFRVFLANGNIPQTPVELSETLGRPPATILKTIGGMRVYKGIRPFIETTTTTDKG